MASRLGCASDIQVFITDQCGAPRICELTNVAGVAWNRILDDISDAVVTVPIGSGLGGDACCDCMALIEPWCHEMHILRNGEVVWQGPVTQVTYGFNQVEIRARDVLAWLQVRIPQGIIENATTPREITDIARNVLNVAFAEHDPCVLKFVVQTDISGGQRPTKFNDATLNEDQFPAYEGTLYDWLENLADMGLDYTVLGRRVLLGVENPNLPPIGTLNDGHILGEISMTKDGYQMANRVFSRFAQDDDPEQCTLQNPGCVGCLPCPALSEAQGDLSPANSCYGPIERLFSEANYFNHDGAKQLGDALIDAAKIAPRHLDFPAGTKLSPDTPWGINDMIPGQIVNVAFTDLCIDVFQSMRLLEVTYELTPDNDETIGISLGPLNAIGSI